MGGRSLTASDLGKHQLQMWLAVYNGAQHSSAPMVKRFKLSSKSNGVDHLQRELSIKIMFTTGSQHSRFFTAFRNDNVSSSAANHCNCAGPCVLEFIILAVGVLQFPSFSLTLAGTRRC